ncbi:MAG: thioredoxin family protein [Gammaproteobacteria bacterium]
MSDSAFGFAVDEDEFEQRVLHASHSKPVMVDFWADWCAPCIHLAPLLDQVMSEYGHCVDLAKVEVDAGDNMRLAGMYALKGFPTVILFRDGVEQGRFSGTKPLAFLREFIETHCPA